MTCRPSERAAGRPLHDMVFAVLIAAVFTLLSLPAHWAFRFCAESSPLWVPYFVLGAVLSVYVVAALLRATRTLLAHGRNDGRSARQSDGRARCRH